MSPAAGAAGLVKCVVWDIDNTLLAGTYLESAGHPPDADPLMTGLLAELAGRGILHAIASRNPPEAAAHAAAVTGRDFAATECGWGRKSDALARIAAGLGIGVDTLAFVDDDPYERAEVAAALPQVLVLSPEEAAGAAQWPQFSPAVITDEARRRGEMYAQRRRRQQAERGFAGRRDDFLAAVGTEITIVPAVPADVARLHELATRTRQFNSAARDVREEEFLAMIAAMGTDVVTARLRDSFGDDGLVGACVVERPVTTPGHGGDGPGGNGPGGNGGPGTWTVPLLMMSCRAMGRGVIDALLIWLARSAARQGAAVLEVPCLLSERNVPLRLALASAGFRAADPGAAGGAPVGGARGVGAAGGGTRGGEARAVFRRDLGGELPRLPGWVRGPGQDLAGAG